MLWQERIAARFEALASREDIAAHECLERRALLTQLDHIYFGIPVAVSADLRIYGLIKG